LHFRCSGARRLTMHTSVGPLGRRLQLELGGAPFRDLPPRRQLWWQLGVLSILVVWIYWAILAHLIQQWYQDPDFSHGFFIPAFSFLILMRNRARFAALRHQPSAWGFFIVAMALILLVVGELGSELFISRLSLLFLIAGIVVLFLGWSFLRAGLAAWLILFLMVPIPAIIFNQLTLPLQLLASRVAAAALPLAGVPVLREGNILHLPSMSLEVADACSGIRSLFSLVSLAAIYGYLAGGTKWIRIALVLAAIPISIFVNSARIVGTGLMVQYGEPQLAHGFFHSFSGLLLFMASLVVLFVVHRFLVWVNARTGFER
jgi:exosortase